MLYDYTNDYMFPVGKKARFQHGVFEGCGCKGGVCEADDEDFEDEELDMEEVIDDDEYVDESCCGKKKCKDGVCETALDKFNKQLVKRNAMSSILDWGQGEDRSFDALDGTIASYAYSGAVDTDGNPDYVSDDEAMYDAMWEEVPAVLASLGVDAVDIDLFLGDGSELVGDKAGLRVCGSIDDYLGKSKINNKEIINAYAFGEKSVMESLRRDEDAELYSEVFESVCAENGGTIFPDRVYYEQIMEASGKHRTMSADGTKGIYDPREHTQAAKLKRAGGAAQLKKEQLDFEKNKRKGKAKRKRGFLKAMAKRRQAGWGPGKK